MHIVHSRTTALTPLCQTLGGHPHIDSQIRGVVGSDLAPETDTRRFGERATGCVRHVNFDWSMSPLGPDAPNSLCDLRVGLDNEGIAGGRDRGGAACRF